MSLASAFILLVAGATHALAAVDTSVESIPSTVIAIREDVSMSEAVMDTSYSYALSQTTQAAMNSASTRSAAAVTAAAVTWNVWGETGHNSYGNLYQPKGYSEHKDGNTVLSTYHYTRTFFAHSLFGVVFDYRGDSGRIWGNYTVTAEGSWCIEDIYYTFAHYVYYGTED